VGRKQFYLLCTRILKKARYAGCSKTLRHKAPTCHSLLRFRKDMDGAHLGKGRRRGFLGAAVCVSRSWASAPLLLQKEK